jgi:sugar/nucleoside kinase (ribokinase family)
MQKAPIDVLAMGNAIVDVLANVEESFIEKQKVHGMIRGAMTLIDEVRAVDLYSQMPPAMEVSGGSAGNTVAGLASFGGKGAFIGKTAKDQLGDIFRHDMKSLGIEFTTSPIVVGAKTGRCLILVTPDGERTFNTFLGAGRLLSVDDMDEDLIASAAITYFEGYLFDPENAKKAFHAAAEMAHKAGRKVSISLSDPFCVDRHRDDFRNFVASKTDILFANEKEIMSLYQVNTFEEALQAVKGNCEVAVLTRSHKGSVIVSGDKTITIKAEPVDKVVDTTGAGDQYAAGFLYGYTQNMPLERCGRLGALAAAEVISHMGPRPLVSYADLVKKAA